MPVHHWLLWAAFGNYKKTLEQERMENDHSLLIRAINSFSTIKFTKTQTLESNDNI